LTVTIYIKLIETRSIIVNIYNNIHHLKPFIYNLYTRYSATTTILLICDLLLMASNVAGEFSVGLPLVILFNDAFALFYQLPAPQFHYQKRPHIRILHLVKDGFLKIYVRSFYHVTQSFCIFNPYTIRAS